MIIKARGTAAQNRRYCGKDNRPYVFGQPMQQGKRTDIMAVKRKIDEGATMADLWESDYPTMVHTYRAQRVYKRIKSVPRRHEMEIITLVGDTGTGKTRWAHETYPNIFPVPPPKGSGTYFDGYCDHDQVLIDEMYGHRFSHGALLMLTDRYPHSVGVHGGTVNFRPNIMVFTSNAHPSEWYDEEKFPWEGGPLQRRLTTGLSRVYRVDEGGILYLLEGEEPPFIGPLNLI